MYLSLSLYIYNYAHVCRLSYITSHHGILLHHMTSYHIIVLQWAGTDPDPGNTGGRVIRRLYGYPDR